MTFYCICEIWHVYHQNVLFFDTFGVNDEISDNSDFKQQLGGIEKQAGFYSGAATHRHLNVLYLVPNLQESSIYSEFVVAVSQSLLNFSS